MLIYVLAGFAMGLTMVVLVGAGFYFGRKQRKIDLEQPTEEQLRKAEDLNRQAEELFNYSPEKAYGGR